MRGPRRGAGAGGGAGPASTNCLSIALLHGAAVDDARIAARCAPFDDARIAVRLTAVGSPAREARAWMAQASVE